ncbi:RNA-binding protein [Bacillus marasmi]|uniref:YlmH family RNA-binding protein n=1 Tax=Bacillus marasmi TaxID=1926279 RepID=UPI0011CA8F15|nr:RNA-binding protein [Bacillus marasmi]
MNIYQHFRPEERGFIDTIIDWKGYVEASYSPKLTDFLDPREQQIAKTIIGEHGDVLISFFGGVENSERKRAILAPDYFQATNDEFKISLYEIEYPSKFVTIEHRQVLGSLMSLGLKRSKFGDILFHGSTVQFFATMEIRDYIEMELKSIGRAQVRLKEIPLENALMVDENWQELSITSSSLRLDTLVSSIYHISRQKAQVLISQGLVKVNWTIVESVSFECGEGDTLSVRGYGRVKISAIEGKTKKDKWRILAKLLK